MGGIALTAVTAAAPATAPDAPAIIDAAHVPPVLTLPSEAVRLRYAIVCAPRRDGAPCDGAGTVFIRRGSGGPFQPYALHRGEESKDGRYYLDLPRTIASSPDGFSYYAVVRDEATGATATIPSGSAAAPELSLPLRDENAVALGRHLFGAVREPDAAAVHARWGSATGEVGLAGSRELGFTGPSAFDVEPDGTVDLLDSVNHRVVRFARRRSTVELGFDPGLGDFAAEPDGSLDVLDPHGVLHRFRSGGRLAWTQKLADRTWAKLDRGGLVLQEPSEEWAPVASGGMPLARDEQRRAARPQRPLANGNGLLLARVGAAELRLAEVRGSTILRSWRITSETPLGEVQLAESVGSGLVVVLRAYTDDRDEFVVLVLGRSGLVQRFSLSSASRTETAPLARFRLARGSLYRLRTTDDGATVDRFDLEVPQ
jgi:hypothetical protein